MDRIDRHMVGAHFRKDNFHTELILLQPSTEASRDTFEAEHACAMHHALTEDIEVRWTHNGIVCSTNTLSMNDPWKHFLEMNAAMAN